MKIEISPDEAISMIMLLKAVELPNEATIPAPEPPSKTESKDVLNKIFGDMFGD